MIVKIPREKMQGQRAGYCDLEPVLMLQRWLVELLHLELTTASFSMLHFM
jgi:hypothetical protein